MSERYSGVETTSSSAAPPPRRRRGLPWLLLALVLAAVLALLLLVRACDDDDGGANGSGTPTAEARGGGELKAGDNDLLAAADGSLARFEGEDVDASSVTVQKVVNESNFWVGSGADSRVFVEVESDEEGADVGLEQGDVVSFVGVVEENLEAETYGLRGEDAELFRRQGAHIRVQAEDLETE